ncbi:MAG: hypothetical protein IBV53_00960 [Candidatus Atribacteria bacterium]
MTKYNLGFAYHTLAEVQDKAKNCNLAIQACQEALKVYTKKEFPEMYRMIKENINKDIYKI